MNTNNKKIDDLIHDESFIAWVLDFENDIDGHWEQFVKNNPDMSAEIATAKQLVIDIQAAKNTPSQEQKDSILNSVHSRIENDGKTMAKTI